MENSVTKIIIDLDGTLTILKSADNYTDVKPNIEVIKLVREYKEKGFEIVIFTSRNMRTFEGSIGKINANTLPIIFDWLKKHNIPFDEIHVGKPWCGVNGFYVDDKTVRPNEFIKMTYEDIQILIGTKK